VTRQLAEYVDGKKQATVATGNSVTLTSGQWYTAQAVIDDDPQNSALQRLRVWVDANRSGSFADPGENVLDTTALEGGAGILPARRQAGLVGLFKQSLSTATHEFDDLKVGCDTNGDGDIDDAGDDIQIDDSFDSRPIELAGQPLVAVEADLDGEGKPGLQPHVQQAQLAVEKVEVQGQAFASRGDDLGPVFPIDHLEALTGLDGGEDGNQAFREPSRSRISRPRSSLRIGRSRCR
jgi:hypothetical protein